MNHSCSVGCNSENAEQGDRLTLALKLLTWRHAGNWAEGECMVMWHHLGTVWFWS